MEIDFNYCIDLGYTRFVLNNQNLAFRPTSIVEVDMPPLSNVF